MLHKYTPSQAAEKLGLDSSEIRFLLLHFREFISPASAGESLPLISETDLRLLQRVYNLVHQDQMDPNEVRTLLRTEASDARMSSCGQGQILAFVGGRSGSGKSTVIWNLASALAARGLRCTIFDGSFGGGGVCELIRRESAALTAHSNWDYHFDNGVHLLWAERLLVASDSPADIERKLAIFDNDSDFILVDTGLGRSDNALRFAMVADEIVAVTTPDVGANADCFGVVRMLKDVDPDLRVSIAINRAINHSEARESFARISGAAGKMTMRELGSAGWIAEDEAVRQYIEKGIAVADVLPTSTSARCFGRIADYFAHRLTPVARRCTGGTTELMDTYRLAVDRGGKGAALAEQFR